MSPEIPFPSPFLTPSPSPEHSGHSIYHHSLMFFLSAHHLSGFLLLPALSLQLLTLSVSENCCCLGAEAAQNRITVFIPGKSQLPCKLYYTGSQLTLYQSAVGKDISSFSKPRKRPHPVPRRDFQPGMLWTRESESADCREQ